MSRTFRLSLAPAVVEVWRSVPGWPYEVSTEGNVRPMAGKVLAPFQNGGLRKPSPYRCVTLYRRRRGKAQRRKHYVAVLVAQVFIGPRPGPDYHADHNDFDLDNNGVDNIRWLHKVENLARRRFGSSTTYMGR